MCVHSGSRLARTAPHAIFLEPSFGSTSRGPRALTTGPGGALGLLGLHSQPPGLPWRLHGAAVRLCKAASSPSAPGHASAFIERGSEGSGSSGWPDRPGVGSCHPQAARVHVTFMERVARGYSQGLSRGRRPAGLGPEASWALSWTRRGGQSEGQRLLLGAEQPEGWGPELWAGGCQRRGCLDQQMHVCSRVSAGGDGGSGSWAPAAWRWKAQPRVHGAGRARTLQSHIQGTRG